MLDQALEYADLGYPVFPCVPGEKRPACANGLKDASTDFDRIEALWTLAGKSANVAIRTDGLLVLDLDPIDGKPNPWLHDDPDKFLDLAVAPLSQTPRGGRHYLFKQPLGKRLGNTQSKIAPGVDTRADGGYILVAPSVVDGRGYSWPIAPLDCRPDQLPEPPGWLIRLLDPQIDKSTRLEVARPSNAIPSGQRNGALTSLGGVMRRAGMSQAEIAAALHQANRSRCTPPMDDSEVDKIAWSVSRYEPDQLQVAIAERHAEQDGLASDPDTQVDKSPLIFPPKLLEVPGFIGEVMEHNLAGAMRPQPILALAGALTLLSVLTGRKIRDEFGTRTNLYIIGVGESGCGKERAREVNKDILYLAGADKYIGPEGIASHAGLTNAVARQPSVLFQLDEIGRMLKTIGHGSATQNPHLFSIATVLMKMFTSAGKVYHGDAYADSQRNVSIAQPHCVLYGTTVPRSFYEGLTMESVTDGFLSRMLIFESESARPGRQNISPPDVPESLIKAVRYWDDLRPPGSGNASDANPTQHVVPYLAGAHAPVDALDAYADSEAAKGGGLSTLWTRVVEKAHKLALLWACSVAPFDPAIDLAAAEWACELSAYLTRKLLQISEEHIAENPYEAKRKRILRLIRDRGERGLSRTELARSARWLPAKERAELVEGLLAAHEITEETIETNGATRSVFLATA